jgi:uncharacterized repeat protein (TIGR01451 family)/gliding motility-associated-like protein
VQDAIDAASASAVDTVKIIEGTILLNKTILIYNKDIVVKGGYDATTDLQIGYTTLDGSVIDSATNFGPETPALNYARKVLKVSGYSNAITSNTIIDHLILQNGYDANGAGLYNQRSSAVYSDIIIRNNIAYYDPNDGYGGDNSGYGAGIMLQEGSPTFKNIILDGNSSAWQGGGAVYLIEGSPTFINVVFSNNTTPYYGGALRIANNSTSNTVVLKNATFYNNTATYSDATYCLGGAICNAANLELYNTVFYNNSALTNNDVYNTSAASFSGSNNASDNSSGNVASTSNFVALSSNPFIASSDIDGADATWATSDDGLVPAAGVLVNAGDDSYNSLSTDLAGTTRVLNGAIDIGAYERNDANRFYVNTDLTTGNNNGSDWDNAYQSLYTALANTSENNVDTIYIANNTISASTTFEVSHDVVILGGYDPATDTRTSFTTLDGGGSITVIKTSDLTSSSLFDHLVIQNGLASMSSAKEAGGMYNSSSSPTITNCVFTKNSANGWTGGGMFNTSSSPTLINCVFDDNTASLYDGYGGAIYNYGSSSIPTLINCVLCNNDAYEGGAIYNVNVSVQKPSVILLNTVFYNNSAGDSQSPDYYGKKSASSSNNASDNSDISSTTNFVSLASDPFVNSSSPIGADGIWGTADDGLIPALGSVLINAGNNSYNSLSTDLADTTRILNRTIDIGAYEGFLFPAPGGVADSLQLWLRADKGTDNWSANKWYDFFNGDSCTVNGATLNTASDLHNFNPGVTFDGSGDYIDVYDGFADFTKGFSSFVMANPASDISAYGKFYGFATASRTNELFFARMSSSTDAAYAYFFKSSGDYTTFTTENYFYTNTDAIYSFNITGGDAGTKSATGSMDKNNKVYNSASSFYVPTNVERTQNFIGYSLVHTNKYYFKGDIPEVIIYNRELSATEKLKVNSYLAIKYGLTLDQTSPTNYLLSNGYTVWNATANAGYNNYIFGMALDSTAALDQRVSKSANDTTVLTIATDKDFTSANGTARTALANDTSAFMVGCNATSGINDSVFWVDSKENVPAGYDLVMSCVWKAQLTNFSNDVYMKFDGLESIPSMSMREYYLVVSTDENFTSIFSEIPLDENGETETTLSGLDANGVYYFTVAMKVTAAPGGVAADLQMWMRADKNVTYSGSTISYWYDYYNGDTCTAKNTPVITSNTHNFNPGVKLDGSAYFNVYSGFSNFTKGMTAFSSLIKDANSGDYTRIFSLESGSFGHYNILYYTRTSGLGLSDYRSDVSAEYNQINNTSALTNPIVDNIYGVSFEANDPSSYSEITGALFHNGLELSLLDGDNLTYAPQIKERELNLIGRDSRNMYKIMADISEIIIYNRELSSVEQQLVNSYLAIKNGITLDQTTATDYLASNDTVVWDASAAVVGTNTFNHDIFGMGRDDRSALYQRISKSINDSAIVTVSTSTDFESSNLSRSATIPDTAFLMIANNGGDTIFSVTDTIPDGYIALERVWQVQETGEVGDVFLQFDVDDADFDVADLRNGNVYYLLYDSNNDGSFEDETPIALTQNTSSPNLWSTGTAINFEDGQIFTLVSEAFAPGGVSNNLSLWLRADMGTDASTTGETLTTWDDQSGAGNVAQNSSTNVTYQNNLINFNPAIYEEDIANQLVTRDNVTAMEFYVVVRSIEGAYPTSSSTSETFPGIIGMSGQDRGLRIGGGGGSVYDRYRTVAQCNNSAGDWQCNVISNVSGTGASIDINGNTSNVNHNYKYHIVNAQRGIGSLTDKISIGGYKKNNARPYTGYFAEAIAYSINNTDATNHLKIESYLALKYGITLDQSVNSGAGQDYLASNDLVIWDASLNTDYNNDIFGIGRDDTDSLYQRISKSINDEAIVTLSLNDDFASSNLSRSEVLNDTIFEMIANNGGDTTWTTTGAPSGFRILNRQWQVQETGTVGNVYLQFDVDDAEFNVDSLMRGNVYFFIYDSDNDGLLSDEIPSALTQGTSSNLWYTATGFDFENGQIFTLTSKHLVAMPDTLEIYSCTEYIDTMNVLTNDSIGSELIDTSLHLYEAKILTSGTVVSINSNGNVSVAANSFCDSTLIIEYKVFEISDPTNYDTDTLVITINADTIKPEIAVPDTDTVYKDASCDITASDTTISATGEATVTDNCTSDPVISYYDEIKTGDCIDTLIRSWYAEDACGNISDTVEQFIFVVDSIKPVVSVPINDTIYKDASCDIATTDTLTSAMGEATATDNCTSNPIISYFDEIKTGDCIDTLIRSWYAEDACGNISDTVKQFIFVLDTIKPEVIAPANDSVYKDAGCEIATTDTLTSAMGEAIATDNCTSDPIISYFDEIKTGDCMDTLIRNWYVEDACGNISDTVKQFIFVLDTIKPEVIAPANDSVYKDANCEIATTDTTISVTGEATVTDNCTSDPVISYYDEIKTGDCIDTLIRSWYAEDACGNISDTVEQFIYMLDTIAPTLPELNDTTIGCNAPIPTAMVVVATDNCDDNVDVTMRTITDGSEGCSGYTITYRFIAEDKCGNKDSVEQVITIAPDLYAPTFNIDPEDQTYNCNDWIPDVDVTAFDNCNGATVTFSTDTIAGACDNNYTIIRKWVAEDNCGNKDSVMQTVTIQDTTPPVFTSSAPSDTSVVCDVPAFDTLTATDGCGSATVTTSEDTTTLGGGYYQLTRTWTATDDCGNSSYVQQNITVESCRSEYTIEKQLLSVNGDNSLSEISAAGDSVSFLINVSNTGNVPLINLVVNDTLTGDSLTVDELAVGNDTSITVIYIATQADVDNGGFVNVATATAQDNDGGTIDPEQPEDGRVVVPSNQGASMTIEKDLYAVNGDTGMTSYASDSDVLKFSITVNNTGNVTLYDLTVTDTLTGNSWTIDTLAVDGSQTFYASYLTTQADVDSGSVYNFASVSGSDPEGNLVTPLDSLGGAEEVPAEQNPLVSIEKTLVSVNGYLTQTVYKEVGDSIVFAITVSNTGNVTLTDLTVSDPLTGDTITVGSLAPESDSIIYVYCIAQQADVDAASITNTASVSAKDPNGEKVKASGQAEIAAEQTPSYSIEKTLVSVNNDSSATKYDAAGDELLFSVTVTNTGNVTLSDLTITDTLTEDSWTLSSLMVDSTVTYTTSYQVSQSDVDSGSVKNIATVTGNNPNGESLSTEESEIVVKVIQTSAMTIEKTLLSIGGDVNATNYDAAGEVVAFEITIVNTGNVTLSNISVQDELTGDNWTLSELAVGESYSETTTYTITQADVDAGGIVNIALASATDVDGDEVAPIDPSDGRVEVPASQNSSMTIDKKLVSINGDESQTDYNEVGDSIVFVITVANTGNVTLSDITVTDELTGDEWTIATLAVGDNSFMYTNYIVTQADLDSGKVVNLATATGVDVGGGVIDPIDSLGGQEIVPAKQEAALSVEKELVSVNDDATVNEYSSVGDILSYSITVSNTGNVTLYNVSVKDTLTGADWTIASIAPNGDTVFTTNYVVTQSDLDAGSVLNIVGVTAVDSEDDDIDPETAEKEVFADQNTSLSINKSLYSINGDVSDTLYDAVGDSVSFAITVSNTGNVSLYGVKVLDDLTGDEWLIDTLTAGSDSVFYAAYIVTQQDINDSGFVNVAIAGGEDGNGNTVEPDDPNEGCEEVFADYDLSVEISKTLIAVNGDSSLTHFSSVGDVLTYQIVVTNTGNVTLTNLYIKDELTGMYEVVSVLLPDSSSAYITDYVVTQEDMDAGSITNIGSVITKETPEQSVPEVVDNLNADLSIDKTVDNEEPYLNESVVFTIIVTNNGPDTATNVYVSDILPAGYTYESYVSTVGSYNATSGIWSVGSLVNGESASIDISCIVNSNDDYLNTAIVSCDQVDADSTNNSSSAEVDLQCHVSVPEIFSPNGDNIQDYFKIECMEGYEDAHMMIYNRWGQLLYEKEGYGNTTRWGDTDAWWNGRSDSALGSEKLPAGTYFYVLDLKDGSDVMKGYVYLYSDN